MRAPEAILAIDRDCGFRITVAHWIASRRDDDTPVAARPWQWLDTLVLERAHVSFAERRSAVRWIRDDGSASGAEAVGRTPLNATGVHGGEAPHRDGTTAVDLARLPASSPATATN